MPSWKMNGRYLKTCNCIASCPCDTIGVPVPGPGCEGIVGMHITEGNFGKVKLNGVKWITAFHWPKALHDGNGTMQAYIDSKTTPEQRDALLQILSGKHGGPLFEILNSVVTNFLDPQFVPITFEFDKKRRKARMVAPGFAQVDIGPLTVPATGDEQRVVVKMPNGFEYREMEVALAKELRGTGPIKFSHSNTHASLATVTHTPKGVSA
jgi:hypothetical protein